MRTRGWLIAGAALALALPAIAQQGGQPQPAPTPAQPVSNAAGTEPTASMPAGALSTGPGESETAVEELSAEQLVAPRPAVEIPSYARRDPWVVGRLDPASVGVGAHPWGAASGIYLSSLMRHMDTPLASRWAHIALRNALLAKVRAPRDVNPVDWVAERAWLLLRLGEADAARMLVSGVDVDRFTPKMYQVAVQSALASADPPALCPLEDGIARVEPAIRALVSAMCASLSGEPESAAAQIDDARRRGRIGGIDLTLAEKVVGAGANSGRAVTIEWDPVDRLTAWRFGLATATGMIPPDRLVKPSSPRLRAFQSRAPLIAPQERLASARIATALGVFSSQSLLDLYSAIYDSTDPSDLADTDAWQLRQAFVGKDRDARLAAIRRLLGTGNSPTEKEAARALVARAASLIEPDPKLGADAPELIAAMLAAGYDRQAARWAGAVRRMGGDDADRSWAMLAVADADARGLDISLARINGFIGRDPSAGRMRSALLVAGLAGLGRISPDAANSLNRRYGLGLGHITSWTRMIDAAAARGQTGTVLVMTGTGLQTARFEDVPGSHLYHSIAALKRTGQDFTARMIAAEALART
jgi:hypothetical protein